MVSYLFHFRRRQKQPSLEGVLSQLHPAEWARWRNRDGHSLLHLAAYENCPDRVTQLINRGVPRLAKSRFEMTAAEMAQFLGHEAFLRALGEEKDDRPLLVYRNRDNKVHPLSRALFEQKLGVAYLDHLVFEKGADLLRLAKKSRRRLCRKALKKSNSWMLALHEDALRHTCCDHICVRWIDSFLGYGVFAAKALPALTFIGTYTGVVKRRTRKNTRHNDYIFGYLTGPSDAPYIIDAREKGNFTRLINHSIEPNLISRWIIVQGVTHIAFFSKEAIPKGKQLTYDYGGYYWKKRSDPMVIK